MQPLFVRVADSDVGKGVFAARAIRTGETILEFHGRPYRRSDPIHRTPRGAYLLQIAPRAYILPEPPGVFVNHSCDPNAGLRGAVTLVALRDIADGEEVRFDYSTTMDEDYWTMACLCGSPVCRGVVRDFKYLPPAARSRYLELGVVPDFVRDSVPAELPTDIAPPAIAAAPRRRTRQHG